jgi:hypothetical protein
VFLIACFRTPFHEETELLGVLRFPFRVRTPLTAEERSLDPHDTTTQAKTADLIIRPDMNKYEAEHAYDLNPWHRLVSGPVRSQKTMPLDAFKNRAEGSSSVTTG